MVRLYRGTENKIPKNKYFLVHRLVATAFIRPSKENEVINHINGIKSDNRPDNLEWTTKRENALWNIELGLVLKGEQHGCSKLTEEDVHAIRDARKKGKPLRAIAARYGVTETLVSMIARRKIWRHI